MNQTKDAKISHIFPLTVFKTKLGLKNEERDILVKEIEPVSKEIERLLNDQKYLDNILLEGSIKADKIASKKIKNIKQLIGF